MSEVTGVEGELHGRRSVIKKAAVAGAVAWTAPTVMSVTAGAADSPDCEGTCAAVVIGSPVFISGNSWQVPLSLAAACPNCITLPTAGPIFSDLSTGVNTVNVNSTRLRWNINECQLNAQINVAFPVSVTCNGTQSTCCVRISFTMTSRGTPDCSDYVIGSYSATVEAGTCS